MRSQRDFARVWLRQHWKLVVGLVAIVGVALSEIPGAVGTVSTVVFAVLGVTAALSDLRGYGRGRRDLHIMEAGPVDPAALQPGPSYGGATIELVEDAHLLRDDRVDELLPRIPTRVRRNVPDHDVPPELAEAQLPMLRFFRRYRGTAIYDAPAVRLETDLGYDQLARCGPGDVLDVEVRVTPFFAGIVTNEFAKWSVESASTGQRWGGRSLTVSRQGVIRDLSQSWLANIVGISTLGITTDGYLVVVSQTEQNVESGGRLAPSGSGSLDPVDLSAGTALDAVLAAGMERELREECDLPDVGLETYLTGFARWIERGAKPEFFGVTLMACEHRLVDGRPASRSESSYVARVRARWLGPDAIAALRTDELDLGEHDRWSVPLRASLNALRRAIERDDSPVLAALEAHLRVTSSG
jgi:hypothetical protein